MFTSFFIISYVTGLLDVLLLHGNKIKHIIHFIGQIITFRFKNVFLYLSSLLPLLCCHSTFFFKCYD